MPPRRSPRTPLSAARRPRRPHLRAAQLAALTLAARLRYLTALLLVLHLGVSPDAAYRLLQQLRRQGLLRCSPWRPGAARGHALTVATLTAAGAQLLEGTAGLDAGDLRRLVLASSARACDVEAGHITTLGHDLDVLVLHGLLLRAAGQPAGVPDAAACRWGLRLEAPLDRDLRHLSEHERARLGLDGARGDRRTVTYIPDALVPLAGIGGAAPGVLLVEVETGKRGRPAREIGAVKAAKMQAVWARLQAGQLLPLLGPLDPSNVAFAVWCPTARFRDQFLGGARRALGGAELPLLATTAATVALRPPRGMLKAQLPPWVGAAAARSAEAPWIGLDGHPTLLLQGEPLDLDQCTRSEVVRFDPFGPQPLFRT